MQEESISNRRKALCIIVETKGSTPRKIGTKMMVSEDGTVKGTIGGGSFEKKVIEDAIRQIEIGKPKLFEHHLLQEHEMCCGGTVKVYIEPEEEKKQLVIFGAGHVGQALAEQGIKAGFNVRVYDDREEYIQQIKDSTITTKRIDFIEAAGEIDYNKNTYIVILTYRHDIDRDLLRYCIKKDRAYLGFIGSKRKVFVTRKLLINEGIASETELDTVDMPIGFDIGAETPFEIAISIIAKLISVKNKTNNFPETQIDNIEQCLQKQL